MPMMRITAALGAAFVILRVSKRQLSIGPRPPDLLTGRAIKGLLARSLLRLEGQNPEQRPQTGVRPPAPKHRLERP
jgi:hypothetical protein